MIICKYINFILQFASYKIVNNFQSNKIMLNIFHKYLQNNILFINLELVNKRFIYLSIK